jgi:hypothetical protein
LRPDNELPSPPEPESLEEAGLPESLIEQLILKVLYFRGELYGQDLSIAVGLKFSVIQNIIETLKLQHLITIKRALVVSSVGSMFALSDAGRERAREYIEACGYSGPAPVPLDQYIEQVRRQKPKDGWLTKESLAKAFRNIVVSERIMSQVGPAVSSGNSLLLYGKPGDGKTLLIECVGGIDAAPVFVPFAIECQGNIVQVYDPIYHHRLDEEAPSVMTVAVERSYDRRWAKCKKPFIVSGGELGLEMLDLKYNALSKVYEAPYQLKANNGVYLIDDFGRQRATPAEVLNRWIVPMERRVDYLGFVTGGKMTAPFEAFLVFSTNLNPADLGDEAFLRRIQYKMLLRGPNEHEFIRIFESFCAARSIPYTRDMIVRYVDKYYKRTGKAFRRCQPRDVLSHVLNMIHFERLPLRLTDQLLDRAFESCFFEDDESQPETAPMSATAAPAPPQPQMNHGPLLPVMMPTCADYWGDRLAEITTAFGSLAFIAGHRDRVTGLYRDAESERQYGDSDTSRVLARLHVKTFAEWLSLTVDQQGRDLARYIFATQESAVKLNLERNMLVKWLAPSDARPLEVELFASNLAIVLRQVCPPAAPEMPAASAPVAPIPMPTKVESAA